MGKKLYVKNIHYDADEKDLLPLFREFGTVVSINIIRDKESSESRGYGFVEMDTPQAAEKALTVNGQFFMNRTLTVAFAQDRAK